MGLELGSLLSSPFPPETLDTLRQKMFWLGANLSIFRGFFLATERLLLITQSQRHSRKLQD